MSPVTADVRSRKRYNVIHYLTVPWDVSPCGTPAPLVIGVLNLATRERRTFGVLQAAELRGLGPADIPANLPTLERDMLDGFYSFARGGGRRRWLNWNMRDAVFGFEALAHRHRMLGGSPVDIPFARQTNLAAVLISALTERYAGDPRLEKIAEKNGLSMLDFLGRHEEGEAFRAGHYQRLQRSLWRKIDIIARVFELFLTKQLLHDGEEQGGCLLLHMRTPSPLAATDGGPNVVLRRGADSGQELDAAAGGEEQVPAGCPIDPAVLSERQHNLLIAMLDLQALSIGKRQKTSDIVTAAEGKTADPDNYKDDMARLRSHGLTDSKKGPNGGCWLTPDGIAMATKLRDSS
jgi:hypothetical protein